MGKDKTRFGPPYQFQLGFPRGSVRKNLPAIVGDTGDVGLIPGLERSSRGGNGNPLQYPCLENPMDRGAWYATSTQSQRVRHDSHFTFLSLKALIRASTMAQQVRNPPTMQKTQEL